MSTPALFAGVGQIEAELKAGRSEEQARNGVERRNGVVAVTVVINLVAGGGQRGRKGAIRIAGEAPAGSS